MFIRAEIDLILKGSILPQNRMITLALLIQDTRFDELLGDQDKSWSERLDTMSDSVLHQLAPVTADDYFKRLVKRECERQNNIQQQEDAIIPKDRERLHLLLQEGALDDVGKYKEIGEDENTSEEEGTSEEEEITEGGEEYSSLC